MFFFILILAAVLVWPPFEPVIRSDGYGYHLWLRYFLHRNYSFCDELPFPKNYSHVEFLTPIIKPGICANIYPVGIALLKLPFSFFQLSQAGQDPSVYEQAVTVIVPYLLSITALVLLGRLSAERSLVQNYLFLALFFVASGWFHYATFDGAFSHAYSAALGGCLIFVMSRFRVATKYWLSAFIFAIVSLLILIRATNIVLIAIAFGLSVILFRFSWKTIIYSSLPLFLGTIFAILLQTLLNYHVTGILSFSTYSGFGFSGSWLNFVGVLFSFERGVFLWTPIYGVIIIFLYFWGYRRVAMVLLAGVLCYALLYAKWYDWRLGAGFGHRGFVDLAPLFAAALICALPSTTMKSRNLFFAITIIITLVSLNQMFSYWSGFVPLLIPTWTDYLYASSGLPLPTVFRTVVVLVAFVSLALGLLVGRFEWKQYRGAILGVCGLAVVFWAVPGRTSQNNVVPASSVQCLRFGEGVLISFAAVVTLHNECATRFFADAPNGHSLRLSWRVVGTTAFDARVKLPYDLLPGGTVTVVFPVEAGASIEVSAVFEGLFWAHDLGLEPLKLGWEGASH